MIHILADVATTVATQAPQAAEAAATISGSIQGGLGCLGAAIGVGLVGARAVEAVGRNPGASGKILVQGILGMALAEAVAFYAIFLGQ
jgi:F-type H+-transporting ATPase subunit c